MLGGERQIPAERLTQEFAQIGNRGRCGVLDRRIIRLAALVAKPCMGSAPPANGGEHGNDRNRRQDPDRQDNFSRSHAVLIAHQPPYLQAR